MCFSDGPCPLLGKNATYGSLCCWARLSNEEFVVDSSTRPGPGCLAQRFRMLGSCRRRWRCRDDALCASDARAQHEPHARQLEQSANAFLSNASVRPEAIQSAGIKADFGPWTAFRGSPIRALAHAHAVDGPLGSE